MNLFSNAVKKVRPICSFSFALILFWTASAHAADIHLKPICSTKTQQVLEWNFEDDDVDEVIIQYWSVTDAEWVDEGQSESRVGSTRRWPRRDVETDLEDDDNDDGFQGSGRSDRFQLVPGTVYKAKGCKNDECIDTLLVWSPYFGCREDHTSFAYKKVEEPIPVFWKGYQSQLTQGHSKGDPGEIIQYNVHWATKVFTTLPDKTDKYRMKKPTAIARGGKVTFSEWLAWATYSVYESQRQGKESDGGVDMSGTGYPAVSHTLEFKDRIPVYIDAHKLD